MAAESIGPDPDGRGRSWRDVAVRVEDDAVAHRALAAVAVAALVILIVVGRRFWFAADDWAFLLTRPRLRQAEGLDAMLMAPQDGHWMVGPIIVYTAIDWLVGLGSYWPYLVVLWISHVTVVALAWAWMRRLGVSAWTVTLMTGVLLLFGAGWQNIFFAIQITYNFSLAAFLAQLLLVDHDGPIDRRDVIGAGLGIVSATSSGFGPFFAGGVGLLLVLRRRWAAAAVAVVPQVLLLAWWWSTWGGDPVGDTERAGLRFLIEWMKTGLHATFNSLVGFGVLSWSAFLLCVAIAVWPGTGRERRAPTIALVVTAVVMIGGIGLRREILGIEAAASPRYQYMVAMLVAPVLAFGLDQACRFAAWGTWFIRLLLVVALARNVVWMNERSDPWLALIENDRQTFSLVAGSPERSMAAPDRPLSTFSPDVWVGDLDRLVADGAVSSRAPVTDDERALVAEALGLP